MSNVLSEEKKQQVIALGRLGWSPGRIQRLTDVRRETAGNYLRAAGIEPRPPGRWARRSPAKPAIEVNPDSGALGQDRNAKAIWQDPVADHGLRGSYQGVKRFAGKLRGSHSPEARVAIETTRGELVGDL